MHSRVNKLTLIAMLCSLNIILSFFSIPLPFAPYIKITFSYLTMCVIGYIYGWKYGVLLGCILDNIKFILHPNGSYIFLFTLVEMAAGLIYGLMLFHKKPTLVRCFVTRMIVSISLNVIATPLILCLYYGNTFVYWAATRLVKNVVLLPIESYFMYVILNRVILYSPGR